MTWTRILNTAYHQQDTNYYCGAAVAQMILDSIGSGLISQDTLYASNHSHSSPGWFTSPGGLNFTLNAFMPPPPKFTSFFIVERGNTEAEGSEDIVRTIYHYGVATGTLVYNCGHWVAVRGVRTSVEPKPGATYSIGGFFINNPWPPTPSFYQPALAPPPPHSATDHCGSGGNRGIANEYVAYAAWQNTYLTGCDAYNVGHLQYISVCDPRRPPLGILQIVGWTRLASGENLISEQQAIEFAQRGIAEHELADAAEMRDALQGATPAAAQLVHRLDRPDEFYYLVTLRRGGLATALARLDALHGHFLGAHALPEPRSSLIIDRETALQSLRGSVVDLGGELGRVPIREGAYAVYPTLVWRPCEESRSPYYPFHQVTIGGVTVYVSYDGKVHPTLHDLGRG